MSSMKVYKGSMKLLLRMLLHNYDSRANVPVLWKYECLHHPFTQIAGTTFHDSVV